MDLKEQKIVIMGGTSGIGLATARAAASAGAKVIITGRDPGKLKNALTELPDTAKGVTVDAMSADALKEFYKNTGEFSHLILSISGGRGGGLFTSLDAEVLRQAFNAKFFAYFIAIQLSLPTIKKDGSIVLVTAGSARSPFPGTSGLAAINGALESMIPTLTLELKPLRINAVSPGVIETPWWEGTPKEQREAAFALFKETGYRRY
jgi:NAD(P)-dependent dehydrogenase (short-subunit alcohol dehydrogenase family)